MAVMHYPLKRRWLCLRRYKTNLKRKHYGCVICGCPVLEFIDFNRTENQRHELMRQEVFLPENMVAVCPSHNKEFREGQIDPSFLASSKHSPFNMIHDDLAFATTSSMNSLYQWEDAPS